MMETDKLIKDLRRNGLGNGTSLGHHSGLCDIAADCIAELTAQLAEKDKQITDLETQHRVEHCEGTGYDCEVRGQLAAALLREMAMRDCMKNIEDAVSRGKLAIWDGLQEAKEVEYGKGD